MVVRPHFTEERKVLPFDNVIELEHIDDWTFRSIVKAYSPAGKENGTYGGNVFAQAAWAAAQTVQEGFLIHSITGWFLLGGRDNEHCTYRVQKIRDGYKYCVRSVTVNQVTATGDMFICTCSFKREETSSVDVQERVDLREVYQEALKGKENDPMLHGAAPSNDVPEFHEVYLPAHPEYFNPIGGVHLRKVEMEDFNRSRPPLERKQLTFYTLRGSLPLPTAPYPPPSGPAKAMTLTREANMHACAHLYASDCNSLTIVPRHIDRPRDFTHMASLSHTVIFHVGIRDLIMLPEPRIDHPNAEPTLWEDDSLPLCNLERHGKGDKDGRKWFVLEACITRAAEGRAMHTSRMWDYESGVHIATTFQDGMVRFKDDAKL